MKLRTELITKPQEDFFIHHQQPLVAAGSCFAQCTGSWLQTAKFDVLVNPFGIIFNPVTLCELLKTAVTRNYSTIFAEDLFLSRDNHYFHYWFHSTISDSSIDLLNKKIETQLDKTRHYIQENSVLLLTLGTAWIYELKDSQKTVANCHKMPSSLFEKKLLSVEQIVAAVEDLLAALPQQVKIILTVSPVIHLKDTLPLNQVSKSVLSLAAYQLFTRYPSRICYFPSYELLRDDLRDYRYFSEDMLHPSSIAERYICEKFADAHFDTATKELAKNCEAIHKQLAHRPHFSATTAHKKQIATLLEQLETLHQKLPRWNEEIAYLKEVSLKTIKME